VYRLASCFHSLLLLGWLFCIGTVFGASIGVRHQGYILSQHFVLASKFFALMFTGVSFGAYLTDWTYPVANISVAGDPVYAAELTAMQQQAVGVQKRIAKAKGKLEMERVQKKKLKAMEKVSKLLQLESERAALISSVTIGKVVLKGKKKNGDFRSHWDRDEQDNVKTLKPFRNAFEIRRKKSAYTDDAEIRKERVTILVKEVIAADVDRDTQLNGNGVEEETSEDPGSRTSMVVNSSFVNTRRRRRRATPADKNTFKPGQNGGAFANATSGAQTRRRRRRNSSGGFMDLPDPHLDYKPPNNLTYDERRAEFMVDKVLKQEFNLYRDDTCNNKTKNSLEKTFEAVDKLVVAAQTATGQLVGAAEKMASEIAHRAYEPEVNDTRTETQKLTDDRNGIVEGSKLKKINTSDAERHMPESDVVDAQVPSSLKTNDINSDDISNDKRSARCVKDNLDFGDWRKPWKNNNKPISCSCFNDRTKHQRSWFQMFTSMSQPANEVFPTVPNRVYPCMATAYLKQNKMPMEDSCTADISAGGRASSKLPNAKRLADDLAMLRYSIQDILPDLQAFNKTDECIGRFKDLMSIVEFYKQLTRVTSSTPLSESALVDRSKKIAKAIGQTDIEPTLQNLEKLDFFVSTIVDPILKVDLFANEVQKLVDLISQHASSKMKKDLESRIVESDVLTVIESIQNYTNWAARVTKLPVVKQLVADGSLVEFQRATETLANTTYITIAQTRAGQFKKFAMKKKVRVLGQKMTYRQIIKFTDEAFNVLDDNIKDEGTKALKNVVAPILQDFENNLSQMFESTVKNVPFFDLPNNYQLRDPPLDLSSFSNTSAPMRVNPLSLYKTCMGHQSWVERNPTNMCNCCIMGMLKLDDKNLNKNLYVVLPLLLLRSKMCEVLHGQRMDDLPGPGSGLTNRGQNEKTAADLAWEKELEAGKSNASTFVTVLDA